MREECATADRRRFATELSGDRRPLTFEKKRKQSARVSGDGARQEPVGRGWGCHVGLVNDHCR